MDAQENTTFHTPENIFDQSNSTRKCVDFLCDTVDENYSIVEHLHKFVGQNVQTTLG